MYAYLRLVLVDWFQFPPHVCWAFTRHDVHQYTFFHTTDNNSLSRSIPCNPIILFFHWSLYFTFHYRIIFRHQIYCNDFQTVQLSSFNLITDVSKLPSFILLVINLILTIHHVLACILLFISSKTPGITKLLLLRIQSQ